MIGSAITPIAIAAPTPYIEVNSTAVTSVIVICHDQRPIAGEFNRRAYHAFRDAGLDQDLRKPGAKNNDDYRGCKRHATALQDLGLDAVDPDASKCRPGDGQNQQHDNRALTADDQHHDSEEYDKKRDPNGHFHDKKTPSGILKELFRPWVRRPPRFEEAAISRWCRFLSDSSRSGAVFGAVSAAIQHPQLALSDCRVERTRFRRKVCLRRRFEFEILVFIHAANQRSAVPLSGDLSHVGWYVTNGESDPPIARTVWRGAVEEQYVVERGLARL
jgi:hypothetical protein